MLTERDKIEQFKRDLRSYTYHQKKAMEIDEKLEELAVKLLGVSSPSAKQFVLENSGNPYGERKLQLLMEEGELVKERNKHLAEMQRIDEALKLLDENSRRILVEIYIKRKKFDAIALENYCSNRKLTYDVNSFINYIINKIKM